MKSKKFKIGDYFAKLGRKGGKGCSDKKRAALLRNLKLADSKNPKKKPND